jgi:ATP-dependent Lhr-like helicase
MHEHFESKVAKEDIIKFIQNYLYVDERIAEQLFSYMHEQYAYAKIPHDKRILIEHWSERQKKYYIFHTLYGRRVNDVLSRAVAFVAGKIAQEDAEIGINDNGFYVASKKPLQVKRALQLITIKDLPRILDMSLEKTEVLGRRFRHCAARSLMILRQYKGTRKSVGRQQMSSRLLIATVKKMSPDFPILKEAKREVLEDLMDINHAKVVIAGVQDHSIDCDEIFTDIPSPFALNLIAQGYSDILRMEDKYAFLKRMHEMVLQKIDLKEQRKNTTIE